MNRYSILRFGSSFEFIEIRLRNEGYECEWSCMLGAGSDGAKQQWPLDFEWVGRESGWEMRRKIKEWAKRHDFKDYKVVRNTKYCRDLHGVVYELWVHRREKVRHLVERWAKQGKSIGPDEVSQLNSIARGLSDSHRNDWMVADAVTNAGYDMGRVPWSVPQPNKKDKPR